MSEFLNELKRRNVIKSAIAYIVVAWVLLQVVSIVLPNIGAPEWVMKTIMLMMVIGFPVWLFFSWVFEVTPDGLKKTKQVSTDQSITETTNKRLNILILVGLVLAIAVSFINKSNVNSNSKDIIELNNSIAVLYFDDLSSGGDTEWFCDGVTEDILTNLSKFKNLTVTSKTSTKRYKKSDKSIPEIARELGVSYIVEGSVRKHEDKIIITAQLIDANDKHIWAQNYNDEFKEVFKIQQDVSQKIVNQLKLAISPEEQKELTKFPTNNLDAYNLVLKGRSFADKITKKDYNISIDLFNQAIALDPNYADAYAELAYANMLSKYVHNDLNLDEEFMSKAKINNEIALNLNPNSVRANSTQGLLLTESEDEKTRLEAEQFFEKALTLNPNDAISHLEISIFYNSIKKDDQKALYHARRAFEINPFSMDCTLNLCFLLLENDFIDEAKTIYENKKSILSGKMAQDFAANIIDSEAKAFFKKGEDWSKSIAIYKNAISKNEVNARIYERFGVLYDTYFNDDKNYAYYLKKAVETDSTDVINVSGYYNALLENKQFKEANQFGKSPIYLKTVSISQQKSQLFLYYYHQNQNAEASEILKDSIFEKNYFYKLLLYSQMGNKNKVYEIMKTNNANTTQKAYVFANLKEKDSLYFYLNKDDINAPNVNSRREFDPYRKDPRYLEFMKKYHLPLMDGINN